MKTQALAILFLSLLPLACQSEVSRPEKGQTAGQSKNAIAGPSAPVVAPSAVKGAGASTGSIQAFNSDAEAEKPDEVIPEDPAQSDGVIVSCMGITGGAHFVIRDTEDPALKQGLLTKGEMTNRFSCRAAEKGEPHPDQSYDLWTCDETDVETGGLHINITYHGFTGWKIGTVLQNQEGSSTPVLIERLGCPLTPYESL